MPTTSVRRLTSALSLSRALQVLKAHFELRAAYVAAGKISDDRLFFLEDGSAISDPEVTRWRWNESLQKLGIRQRGPYHARHSSVTWALMLAKNLLWVAKQHGHSVEVMLRMYAAWIEGATEADIQAIRDAMDGRPKVPLLPFALASPKDSARQIVLRPLTSPGSVSSPVGEKLSVEKPQKKVAERVGLLAADRRGWAATSKNRSAIFVEPGLVRPHILHRQIKRA